MLEVEAAVVAQQQRAARRHQLDEILRVALPVRRVDGDDPASVDGSIEAVESTEGHRRRLGALQPVGLQPKEQRRGLARHAVLALSLIHI